jgi:hypothetical protein
MVADPAADPDPAIGGVSTFSCGLDFEHATSAIAMSSFFILIPSYRSRAR